LYREGLWSADLFFDVIPHLSSEPFFGISRSGLQAISQVSLMENVGKTLLHRYFPYSKGAWP
jgi:hypothetical protein